MSRRVTLPRADDLFRPTAVPDPEAPKGKKPAVHVVEEGESAPAGKPAETAERTHSGRVKHDEKMTVYITSDELLELEQARLVLRRTTGSAVDRGRLVRAAVALALADLEANGEDSALVQRLTRE